MISFLKEGVCPHSQRASQRHDGVLPCDEARRAVPRRMGAHSFLEAAGIVDRECVKSLLARII